MIQEHLGMLQVVIRETLSLSRKTESVSYYLLLHY